MTVIISAVVFGTVSAQQPPMTDAQINRIRTNCTTAKNTLTRLHVSDALLRVNRGQLYDSITNKLMNSFDSRVGSNNLDASGFITITNSYNSTLTNFRSHYQTYEEQLSAALKIDCIKEPVSFYDSVASARAKRAQVHSDVVSLNQSIDAYQAAFTTFATNLTNTGSGGSAQ